jgi:hypothetical protein
LFSQTVLSQSIFHHTINEEYLGIKLNYGFRPLTREESTIEIGIDSLDNEFGTYVYDQYKLGSIYNMKGFSMGIEYGSNNVFVEGQMDIASRNKTSMIGTNIFLGYNFTFMHNHPVAIRPAVGLNYSWLWTELGTYASADSNHSEIYITQSNALIGVRPRIQVEVPLINIKEDAVVFFRVEGGYQFSAFTSRFIKLKAERTYANDNGNVKNDSDRFYLDGETSGYYINNKHVNRPPTSFAGLFYSIEIALKILAF